MPMWVAIALGMAGVAIGAILLLLFCALFLAHLYDAMEDRLKGDWRTEFFDQIDAWRAEFDEPATIHPLAWHRRGDAA